MSAATMSGERAPAINAPRAFVCARCNAAFGCNPGGACWCMDEEFRLPMPAAGSGADCLCPDCLRALAASANARAFGDA